MGVVAQDVHIHLGTPQAQGLFAEAQHLLRLQIQGQGGAIAVPIRPVLTALIEQIRVQFQQPCQTIAKIRPSGFADQTRLEIERIGEAAGGQHTALAIQETAADG